MPTPKEEAIEELVKAAEGGLKEICTLLDMMPDELVLEAGPVSTLVVGRLHRAIRAVKETHFGLEPHGDEEVSIEELFE